MHSKSHKIEVRTYDDANTFIAILIEPLYSRYQIG